jgi:2-methylisocitrate lyase-like PEP mutase family enzyme
VFRRRGALASASPQHDWLGSGRAAPLSSEVRGPLNVIRLPQTPSLAELAALRVARVSWATLLHRDAMARFGEQLATLQE